MTTDDTAERLTSAPGVDTEEATNYLREVLQAEISPLRPLRQGGWSDAYAFDTDDGTLVARFSRYRDDFDNDRYASRWNSANLPVPDVLRIEEGPDGFVAVSRFVHGQAIDTLDGAELRATLSALFAMLDTFRTADLSGTSGLGGWNATGQASRQSWADFLLSVGNDTPEMRNHGWRSQLAASPIGIERFDETHGRLAELVRDLPVSRHLLHSDLLNYNLLVANGGIAGVIDWGCGLYGDFLYDVAWIAHYWPYYPAWQEIDFLAEYQRHAAEIGLDMPMFEERILASRIRIGLDNQAYNTYMRRWDNVELDAAATLVLARSIG